MGVEDNDVESPFLISDSTKARKSTVSYGDPILSSVKGLVGTSAEQKELVRDDEVTTNQSMIQKEMSPPRDFSVMSEANRRFSFPR